MERFFAMGVAAAFTLAAPATLRADPPAVARPATVAAAVQQPQRPAFTVTREELRQALAGGSRLRSSSDPTINREENNRYSDELRIPNGNNGDILFTVSLGLRDFSHPGIPSDSLIICLGGNLADCSRGTSRGVVINLTIRSEYERRTGRVLTPLLGVIRDNGAYYVFAIPVDNPFSSNPVIVENAPIYGVVIRGERVGQGPAMVVASSIDKF